MKRAAYWFETALVVGAYLSSGVASATTVGPDSYGYVATDEIPYAWVDISGTGTNLNLTDDSFRYQAIGFDFSFYGADFSNFSVGSNGVVHFSNSYITFSNSPIPSANSSGIDSLIAVYWDDLNPSAAGGVFYDVLGAAGDRRLVVQWNAVPHFGASDAVTAQAILFEATGDILLQYLNPSSEAGGGATVGIQNSDTVGLQWLYNQAVLTPQQAICFSAGGTACGASVPEPPTPGVPEPATLALLGLGLAGLGAVRRRRLPA